MSWCQPQRRRGNERARARCRAAMALVRGGVARHDGHCDGSNLPKMRAWRPSIHPVRRTLATIRPAFVESGRALSNRRLQPLRYLHDCSDCFRLERLPDGICSRAPLHPMACPSTNSEVQDLFAKLLEKRFDRQPCCAGILYECMRFLTGHYKVNAAEEFLSFGCFRTEHRLVSAYINRIINVAWCFGHGILLDPEAGILCPFQPALQGGNCEITLRRGRS